MEKHSASSGGPPEQVRLAHGRLRSLSPATASYATEVVDILLDFAHAVGTSDMHLQPTRAGLDVRFRSDGVLQSVGVIAPGDIGVVDRTDCAEARGASYAFLEHGAREPRACRFDDAEDQDEHCCTDHCELDRA